MRRQHRPGVWERLTQLKRRRDIRGNTPSGAHPYHRGMSMENRIRDTWDRLIDSGFKTRSPNPEWYKAVIVSMLLGPGTRDNIVERAHEVLQSLGLANVSMPKDTRWHPCFHLGHDGPRRYFIDTGRDIGNFTPDDFGLYCATHNREWRECRTTGYACTPNCRYGMRLQ